MNMKSGFGDVDSYAITHNEKPFLAYAGSHKCPMRLFGLRETTADQATDGLKAPGTYELAVADRLVAAAAAAATNREKECFAKQLLQQFTKTLNTCYQHTRDIGEIAWGFIPTRKAA